MQTLVKYFITLLFALLFHLIPPTLSPSSSVALKPVSSPALFQTPAELCKVAVPEGKAAACLLKDQNFSEESWLKQCS